jgi:putative hydrolase of the HAD superfamily
MHNDLKYGEIKTLFLDIGGVLLTNGWGHESRALAAVKFGLDIKETEARHALAFETYELGRMTLNEYVKLVIFYEHRAFTEEIFKAFMFDQSAALTGVIDYFIELKRKHQLKVIAVSNEGRELNEYRIKHFRLDELFDAYISSCYVQLHKPDKNMLQMACDISHTPAGQALYIDDNRMLADIAFAFGCHTLHFQGLDTTRAFIDTCTFHKKSDKIN